MALPYASDNSRRMRRAQRYPPRRIVQHRCRGVIYFVLSTRRVVLELAVEQMQRLMADASPLKGIDIKRLISEGRA